MLGRIALSKAVRILIKETTKSIPLFQECFALYHSPVDVKEPCHCNYVICYHLSVSLLACIATWTSVLGPSAGFTPWNRRRGSTKLLLPVQPPIPFPWGISRLGTVWIYSLHEQAIKDIGETSKRHGVFRDGVRARYYVLLQCGNGIINLLLPSSTLGC